MKTCLFVSNKNTKISDYLENRGLFKITRELHRLSSLNIETMNIIDVDKLLFIHYFNNDDIDLRTDLNALRSLLHSPFFTVDTATFIIVNNKSPIVDDLIHASLRSTKLNPEDIEIIHHSDTLMLDDVAKYLTGTTYGVDTSSTYQTVYISEANLDEKDRFTNEPGDIKAVLPALTDAVQMYKQRVKVESISTSTPVAEKINLNKPVQNFSNISPKVSLTKTSNSNKCYLVSGFDYTAYEKAVKYISACYKNIGKRVLVIAIDYKMSVSNFIKTAERIPLTSIQTYVPKSQIASIECGFNSLGYVLSTMYSIRGIDEFIFLTPSINFKRIARLITNLYEDIHTVFCIHYSKESIDDYLINKFGSKAVFLSTKSISEEFDIQSYREDFKGTVVAMLPLDNINYTEFHDLVIAK